MQEKYPQHTGFRKFLKPAIDRSHKTALYWKLFWQLCP